MSAEGAKWSSLWRVMRLGTLLVLYIALSSCDATALPPSSVPTSTPLPDNKNISVLVYEQQPNQSYQVIPVEAKIFVHGTSYMDDSDYGGYYVDECLTTQFIVATATGYTIERVPCETGRREYTVTLFPLLSDTANNYTWSSAGSGANGCSGCHANFGDRNEFNEWQLDGHSTVLRDSYFWPLYMGMDVNKNPGIPTQWKIISSGEKVREINPSPHGPGYQLDYPGEQGNCAYCHAPATVHGTNQQDKLIDLINGFGNYVVDARLEGVTCDICHRVTGVVLGGDQLPYSDRPGVLSMSFVSASFGQHLAVGPRAKILPPVEMKVACSRVFSEGEFCAACHYGKFFDTVIYNSYGEWLQSDYSRKVISPDGITQQSNPRYRSCQDCHMLFETDAANTSIEQRSACTLDDRSVTNFNHNMMKYVSNADTRVKYNKDSNTPTVSLMIEDAASLVVRNEYDANTNSLRIITQVTNLKAGHKLPTDSPLRHLILVVEARDELNHLLPLVQGETIPMWGGMGLYNESDAVKNYGGMPGKIYANLLADRDTNISPTAAYWNPTKHVFEDLANGRTSDTRLRPGVTDEAAFSFAVPAAGNVSIRVRLVYRYAFVELARQKGWNRPDVLVTLAECTVNPTQITSHECK